MLLVEPDPERREVLVALLRWAGIDVTGSGGLAEIARWPTGAVVVTAFSHFTPWWKHVGASHVIVLADTPREGADACISGATAWVFRDGPIAPLLNLLDVCRLPRDQRVRA